MKGSEGESLRLHAGRVKEVPQVTQSSLGADDAIKGLEHSLITGLVEEELDPNVLCTLHVDDVAVIRHGNYHPVAIDITDRGSEVEVFYLILSIDAEENHRLTELKVMFNLFVIALTVYLHDKLVQRVVITLAHLHRPPGIATLYLPLQAHLFGLLAVGFLLGGILHLKQQPLLLECQYRRNLLISHNFSAKV